MTQHLKRQRRERILQILERLGTKRINKSALARRLGVDWKTIDKDLKAIVGKIKKIPVEELAVKHDLLGEKAIIEALEILRTSNSDNAKIGAIRVLMDAAEKEISWRCKLGLLNIEPPKPKEEEKKITMFDIIKIQEESKDEAEILKRIRELCSEQREAF